MTPIEKWVMSYNPTLLEASDWWKASNCGTNIETPSAVYEVKRTSIQIEKSQ